MICADREMFSAADARAAAEALAQAQFKKILSIAAQLVARLSDPPATVVISGRGEFLARQVVEKLKISPTPKIVSLSADLGPELSRCAPAHALAVLAREGAR
jgi:uncharacterized hydantoinase/oxoprolinase family protein